MSISRLTFSFDSSGWLYVYHLGVAHYLQRHVLPHLEAERVAFSGSSGGALVAAALAGGIDIEQLAHHVIGCHGRCRFNPFRMLPAAEEAIAKYMPPDGHLMANGRLRVLLTRVRLAWMRPLFGPEAVSEFASVAHLRQVLRASCHIPVLGGVLPYQVDHIGTSRARGASRGYDAGYYDGVFWPSVLYMWRAFDASDTLFKVSGLGWPTAHIRPPLPLPLHWVCLPPPPTTLWRLFAAGYDDAARRLHGEGGGRALPDGVRAALPPPRAAKAAPMPVGLIALGWAHLLLLTCLFPLVPPYLACRELLQLQGRGDSKTAVLLRRGLLLAPLLAIWPLVLAYLVTRWACGRVLRELIALHDEGQAHATATSTRDAARREAKRI